MLVLFATIVGAGELTAVLLVMKIERLWKLPSDCCFTGPGVIIYEHNYIYSLCLEIIKESNNFILTKYVHRSNNAYDI